MAKQAGLIRLTGTIGNVTFYEMNGEYYARSKSSLTAKRVKKDPSFERTRMYAHRLGLASRAAGRVYRSLPRQEREVALYRRMVSKGQQLLKENCAEELLENALRAFFLPVRETMPNTANVAAVKETPPVGMPMAGTAGKPLRNAAGVSVICVNRMGKLARCKASALPLAGMVPARPT